jgi:hypothetical protein
LFCAITSANARHIVYNPDLAWRYAAADQPPPDGLREAVSIRQVAADLGLPYATIYRHVMQMVTDGLCVRTAEGIIVPPAAHQRPDILASGSRLNHWWFATLRELSSLGFDFAAYDHRPKGLRKTACSRLVRADG